VRADAVEIGQSAINRRSREVNRNTDPHHEARSCRVESRLVQTLRQPIAFEIARNPMDSRVDSTFGTAKESSLLLLGGRCVDLENDWPGVREGCAQASGVEPRPQQNDLVDACRDSLPENVVGVSDAQDDEGM
jgi:hypothetical protein